MTWSWGHLFWILLIAYCLGVFDWLAQFRDGVVARITHRPGRTLSKRERRRLVRAAAERDVGIDLLRRVATREREGLPALDTALGNEVDTYLGRFDATTTLRALDESG